MPKPFPVLLATWIIALPALLRAEPTPDQAMYWWQDELRCVALALNLARTGRPAQWPQMTVAAGTAVLPLPPAGGPIRADGQLDEAAWGRASSFPVGPIFDDFIQGPFWLQVSACRDAKHLYLGIESPRNLAELGSLGAAGELFAVGDVPFRLGHNGKLSAAVDGQGSGQQRGRHVLELALPLPAGEVSLSFSVENLRRVEGELPAGAAGTGLSPRKPARPAPRSRPVPRKGPNAPQSALWLRPITVRLLPSPTAARGTWSGGPAGATLLWQLLEPGKPPTANEQKLAAGAGSVVPYSWKAAAAGQNFAMDGFFYFEPTRDVLAAAGKMLRRVAEASSTRLQAAPTAADLAGLEAELRKTSYSDSDAWRALYCRAREFRARAHLSLLDAPLLLVKQHPYFAGHIYDDFYPWHPGGGIYILEEPHLPRPAPKVRAVIDATTKETLGEGVYRDPDLSWDARQLVFAAKRQPNDVTSLYTIGVDGRGLKRLTASEQHSDYQAAWLPDGRIVFISTRPRALVPCFNSGVGTLHVMASDGSGIQNISVNNVNEFDPSVLPDGRILYGRWEYVDKTALYMQSLWTVSPGGRMEEALFKNNLPKPTACLDARAVPGTHLVACSLTPHNGQAVGAIGMIDTRLGKNDLAAITNFTPEYPVEMDQGLTTGPCDPWPLSADDLLMSNNAVGAHGVIELVDRYGSRELVYSDPAISCYAPMLVQPRSKPPVVGEQVEGTQPGRFLVVDVYQGLTGIPRGSIHRLRIVEETARTSGIPPGGRWWNQAFLVSWQGAYIVKNILGTVPVHEDGSAYFEAPPGKALYFEALDAEGREIQRMRTFVQAAPGITRSCVGCHEQKKSGPPRPASPPRAMLLSPAKPQPESWGSGYIDYPSMVQPVLDKYCVRCHGGPEGFAKGMDFSGGWTWAFSLSYETLLKHRLTGFLNCENGSVHTSRILLPKTIGSGAAPLAEILIKKHPEISRRERDLVLAWMDTNSNYYGSWDYTPHATCDAILSTRSPLASEMQAAGCTACHASGHVGSDWINLQTPEWSRILRAPMAKAKGELGAAMCRKRKAREGYPLITQAVQPPDVIYPSRQPPWDGRGEAHISFASTADPHYQAMLAAIRRARAEALARPRVDMPGAEVVAGECRMLVPMAVPPSPPNLAASLRPDGAVELAWQRTAHTIGLQYELHRGPAAGFAPSPATEIGRTTAGKFLDLAPPIGSLHYAMVVSSGTEHSLPAWAAIDVPAPPLPPTPKAVVAKALPGEVSLLWEGPEAAGLRYDVYRAHAGTSTREKLNRDPLTRLSYNDAAVQPGTTYTYTVRSIDRRGQTSVFSAAAQAAPLAEIHEPVFSVSFDQGAKAKLLDGRIVAGRLLAGAKIAEGCLVLSSGGHCTFEHQPEFDLTKALSLEMWVWIEREASMPVLVACGGFNTRGWFLQRFGNGWRWHLAPISCDGGRPATGRWMHLVGTFSGDKAALYQDGRRVASAEGVPSLTPWAGPLVLGQYSSPAESYQVQGKIASVKLYRRALRPAEVAEHFAKGRY